MKLYQQAGVNPLMGCLPVVLQLPMFFALYSVLKAIAEWKPGQPPKYGLTLQMVESAQHAKILGVTVADKFLFTDGLHVPLHAKAVILLAVLISMTTTYLTVRQSMKRGMMPAATPGQPDGPVAEVHDVHHAVVRPVRPVLAVWAGSVLGDDELLDARQQWVLFRRLPAARTRPARQERSTAPAVAPVGDRRGRSARPSPCPRPRRGQDGSAAAQSNGAAKPAADQQSSNGAQPGKSRKAAGSPATGSAAQDLRDRRGPRVPARSPRRTAAAGGGCCAGSASVPNPSPSHRPPRLSSSGSNASDSPAASVLASGEAPPQRCCVAAVRRDQPRT